MWVTRYQFPIGQGCFHAGTIGTRSDSRTMHYVYDCGSRQQRALQSAIGYCQAKIPRIRALFLSHFDIDHVAGLDRLLAAVQVHTVYVPYVDPSILILDLIEAEANGALSASLVEASISPESWFGRRGVERVVRIRNPDGPPPDDQLYHISTEFRPEPEDDQTPEEIGGDLPVSEQPEPRQVRLGRTGERSDLLQAAPGFRIMVHADHKGACWLLYPHVDPAPKERRSAFRNAIRGTLGLQPYQRLTSPILSAALRNVEKRNRLRECYDEIISGGAQRNHNRVSMSLYSGPCGSSLWDYWTRSFQAPQGVGIGLSKAFEVSPIHLCHHRRSAVGWLGTGDAVLSRETARRSWQEAYRPQKDQISTLLLPHHGSRRSFHGEVLQFPSLELCVASASYPSQYDHPNGEVVGSVQGSGKVFWHVTQYAPTGLVEEMTLA